MAGPFDGITFLPELRDRVHVFDDRTDAGRILAGMLADLHGTATTIVAVPAGGVPVAVVVAERLGLPVDVAVVSKVTPPGNTEAGYGAVAFDGSVRINRDAVRWFGLSPDDVAAGVAATRAKVARRVAAFRGNLPATDYASHPRRPSRVVRPGTHPGSGTSIQTSRWSELGKGKKPVSLTSGSSWVGQNTPASSIRMLTRGST